MSINKIIKVGFIAILSLSFCAGTPSVSCYTATTPAQKAVAAEIQTEILKEIELENKIKSNESKIKKLEEKLLKQKSEKSNEKGRFWFFRSREKIEEIKNKISKTKTQLKEKKQKRIKLDEELAIILQWKELESTNETI